MKRNALGKGLRSLIPEKPAQPDSKEAVGTTVSPAILDPGQIDIDRIRPNPMQPREDFDESGLDELAQSMKTQGVLQPVVVRKTASGMFDLVAGERRWRAAQRAGIMRIPAVVRDVPDERLLEFALIENLQREGLNPIEEAQGYRTLIDTLQLTQQQVAERVGKQRATIANAIRLLSLPEPIQQRVRRGELSMGHARALAGVADRSTQSTLADRCVKEGWPVRALESEIARLARAASKRKPVPSTPRDPNVVAAEESLQRALGTKVRIVQARRGGHLEIHYFSEDELERIYQLVLEAAKRRRPA